MFDWQLMLVFPVLAVAAFYVGRRSWRTLRQAMRIESPGAGDPDQMTGAACSSCVGGCDQTTSNAASGCTSAPTVQSIQPKRS